MFPHIRLRNDFDTAMISFVFLHTIILKFMFITPFLWLIIVLHIYIYILWYYFVNVWNLGRYYVVHLFQQSVLHWIQFFVIFIHIDACTGNSVIFTTAQYTYPCLHNIFIHFSLKNTLIYSKFAITYNATVNKLYNVSCTPEQISPGCMLQIRISGLQVNSASVLLE